jgi:hypothetical protein
VSLCETLRDECAAAWQGLHEHPFILELADGTLAPERFRFYCEQDLFFLPELARAVAIGASRSDETEMRTRDELAVVVGRRWTTSGLLDRVVELGAEDRGGLTCAAPACTPTGFPSRPPPVAARSS